MKNIDTNQIRTAFLEATYRELFGTCPDAEVLAQFVLEMNKNGK